MSEESSDIELRPDGVLIVRIPSGPFNGRPLPDAVFAFRVNDPQYEYWLKSYYRQQDEKNKERSESLPPNDALSSG